MAGKREGKISKTAEASMATSDRRERQGKQLPIVTLMVCDPCKGCDAGRDAIAKRDAFRARKPRGMYVDIGRPCPQRKSMPGM